jgi:ABC-type glycerol-3-phosphate transport system substrate-binding protein
LRLTALFLPALALAACGQQTAASTVAATTAVALPTKEHPGTTCTFSLSSGVYLDKLLTMAAGGDAPDVFFVSPTDLPAMTAKALLQPLDADIARSHDDVSDFVPAALQQYQRAGKTYGIPRGFGMKVMTYNVDLFKKVGLAPLPTDWKDTTWTFSAFLETAKQLRPAAEQLGSV